MSSSRNIHLPAPGCSRRRELAQMHFSGNISCGTMARKGEPVKIFISHANAGKPSQAGMTARGALLAAGLLFSAAVCGFYPARAQTSAPQKEKTETALTGNADAGKKIFMKDGCFECHGTEGQGAAQGAGPRIGPPLVSQEGLIKYVRAPSGQMPPYTSKVISDQELADIFAYLQSRPKGTPGKDIPLLN